MQIDFQHDESTTGETIRVDSIELTTISTTRYSPPEVKIREITIHEPSSFLKRGHKLQSIRTIHVDSCQDYVEISQASQARMARGGWALFT